MLKVERTAIPTNARTAVLVQLVRLRYQFLSCFLLAVLAPVFLRWGADLDMWLRPEQFNTIIASTIAILIGLVALKQVGTFPGVRETYYLAPVMVISFLFVLAALLLIRVEYNRYLFPFSLLITVSWLFATFSMSERLRKGRFAVVLGGRASNLFQIRGTEWIPLSRPSLPSGEVDGLVVDLRSDLDESWERFVADCALSGIRVFHYQQIQESISGRVEINHLSENTLGSINPNAAYLKIKQSIDWVAALLAVLLFAPLALLVAFAIKVDTPGPVIFRQRRIGFRGRAFTVYKFRTMVVAAAGADDRASAVTADGDSRVTTVGRFLRRCRIDEVPQLINVLKGEMSWIGPRPEAVPLSRWYEDELPYYRYRHIVRPGITGWAQINQGHVADIDQVLEKLHYDFYYIKNFSPWLDIVVLMRTVWIVLSGFGAR